MNTVGVSELEELQAGLRGSVLLPGEAQYDAARRIWNAMIGKCPAMIVRCAVNFAREHGLPLAVRGGSHSIAGSADERVFRLLHPLLGTRLRPAAGPEPGARGRHTTRGACPGSAWPCCWAVVS